MHQEIERTSHELAEPLSILLFISDASSVSVAKKKWRRYESVPSYATKPLPLLVTRPTLDAFDRLPKSIHQRFQYQDGNKLLSKLPSLTSKPVSSSRLPPLRRDTPESFRFPSLEGRSPPSTNVAKSSTNLSRQCDLWTLRPRLGLPFLSSKSSFHLRRSRRTWRTSNALPGLVPS